MDRIFKYSVGEMLLRLRYLESEMREAMYNDNNEEYLDNILRYIYDYLEEIFNYMKTAIDGSKTDSRFWEDSFPECFCYAVVAPPAP